MAPTDDDIICWEARTFDEVSAMFWSDSHVNQNLIFLTIILLTLQQEDEKSQYLLFKSIKLG